MNFINKQSQDYFKPTAKCPECTLPPVEIVEPVRSVPPETRIQYIPFYQTVNQFQRVQKIQKVPREVVTTEYQVVRKRARRPVQKSVTDFYTVQHITQYELDYVTEKKVQYVPREVIKKKVQYVPFQRQIVHYPQNILGAQPYVQTQYVYPVNPPPIQTPPAPPAPPVVQHNNIEYKSRGRKGFVYRNTKVKANQLQSIQFLGNLRETVIFQNIKTKKVLECTRNREINLAPITAQIDQRFLLHPVDGGYIIQFFNSDYVLQPVKRRPVLKGGLQLSEFQNSASQIFLFESQGGEKAKIVSAVDRSLALGLSADEGSLQFEQNKEDQRLVWYIYNLGSEE